MEHVLSKKEIKERMKIISNTKLENIPFSILPEVFSLDYYFISYSHKDYKEVYYDIFNMQYLGVNIWYDRGIPAGKDWKEVAKRNISPFECKGVILYISENSLTSSAVIDEVRYIQSIAKPFVAITIPFTKDYVYHGKSVKNKSLSINEMIQVLYENKAIKKSEYEELLSLFPDTVIFLPLSTPTENRVEKIDLATPKVPLLGGRIEIVNDYNYLHVSSIRNKNVDRINLQDFYDLIIYLGGRTDEEYRLIFDSSSLSNCEYLEFIFLSTYSSIMLFEIGLYAFANDKRFKGFFEEENNDIYLAVADVLDGAFYNCVSLERYIDPKNKPLGSYAYYNCSSLKDREIHISDTKEIGDYAFAGCISIEKVHLNNAITRIGIGAFKDCYSLREIDIHPIGIKEINDYTFYNCTSLPKIFISNKVTRIGEEAFYNCSYLSVIGIENVIQLGKRAFYGCNKLICKVEYENIEYLGYPGNIYLIAFRVKDKNKPINKINDECQIINDGLFEDNKNIAHNFILPKSVVHIGSSAFKNTDLEEIIIPEGVVAIEEETFANCSFLENVKLPELLNTIRNKAFYNCSKLEYIALPNVLSFIGESSFESCSSLKEIYLPHLIWIINKKAFMNCSSLKKVELPDMLKQIREYAFYGCQKLTSVLICYGIEKIYPYAFSNCSSLKDIYFRGEKWNWRSINIYDEADDIQIEGKYIFYWWDYYEDVKYIHCYDGTLFNPLLNAIPEDKKITIKSDKDIYCDLYIEGYVTYRKQEYIIARVYEEEDFDPNKTQTYIFIAKKQKDGTLSYELSYDPILDSYVLNKYCEENGLTPIKINKL